MVDGEMRRRARDARNLGSSLHPNKARSRCYGNQCYTRQMSKPVTAAADVAVDAYVFDTLMRDLIGHVRATSAVVVYLQLWRLSLGAGEPTMQASLRDIAEATGLSIRGVQ